MALLCGESAPPCWGNAAAVAAAANAGWRPLHWPCGGGTHPPPRPTSLPRSPLSPPPPPQDYHGPDAQLLTHFVSSPIRGGTGGAPAGGGTPPRGGRARCRGRASPRWRLASSPPPGAAAARPGGRANAHCRRRRAGKWHSRRRMPPCRFPPPFSRRRVRRHHRRWRRRRRRRAGAATTGGWHQTTAAPWRWHRRRSDCQRKLSAGKRCREAVPRRTAPPPPDSVSSVTTDDSAQWRATRPLGRGRRTRRTPPPTAQHGRSGPECFGGASRNCERGAGLPALADRRRGSSG